MPRITTCSGDDYCGKCIRCELLQEEGRAEQVERERDELREALSKILPPTHGLYGGPLVYMQAYYEDGSEGKAITPHTQKMKISHEAVEKARRVLDNSKTRFAGMGG